MGRLRTILIASIAGIAGVAVVIVIVLFVAPHVAPSGNPSDVETATYAAAAPVPHAASPAAAGISYLATDAWISSTSKATGIPARALRAYAGAAIDIQNANPACGIGWNTLAAIGEIESRHGTIFGGSIAANGVATPAIFGVALDGIAAANIPDSDKGTIDGDATIDRAVGPMQLIPQTWRNWHVDANADGVQDPQNIDDATFAAAHYLCRAGKNLSGAEGWRTAVLAYNSSQAYLNDIIRWANRYADQVGS